jgi:hypothetical protein
MIEHHVMEQANPVKEIKHERECFIFEEGCPGHCPDCGKAWQWVRPGKSQPNCDCHYTCHICHVEFEYFDDSNRHPTWPNFMGAYCRYCGPFPGKFKTLEDLNDYCEKSWSESQ